MPRVSVRGGGEGLVEHANLYGCADSWHNYLEITYGFTLHGIGELFDGTERRRDRGAAAN